MKKMFTTASSGKWLSTAAALLLLSTSSCEPNTNRTSAREAELEQRIARLEAQIDDLTAEREQRPALKLPGSEQPIYPVQWTPDGTEIDDPFLGSPRAPFLVMVFMDYRSAKYKSFAKETLPKLKEKYAGHGIAKIVLRDFPLPTNNGADRLAHLANCAGEQGMYWVAHDSLLFFDGIAPDTSVETFADRLAGIDRKKLQECTDRERFRRDLQDDRASANKLGVAGVPAILVAPNTGAAAEGVMIRGAQPFGVIQREIEAIRAKG